MITLRRVREGASTSVRVLDLPEAAEDSARDLIPQLVERHGQALRRFLLRRLRNPDEAEDALQETYLRMLKYRDATSLEFPQALVFRVARSVLIDRARRRATRRADKHVAIDNVEIGATEPSQERTFLAQEEVLLLRQAIKELPPRCKQAFLLSRLRQRTYPQIAEQMGISVKMVEKHITHALALCRQKVGGRTP